MARAVPAHAEPRASRLGARVPLLERLVFGALFLGGLVGIAWLVQRGWSYYTTPLIERPRHPDYWLLKPGGTWGRTYGLTGSTLLILMLSYSVRRRVRALRHLGPLRLWLSFHIFCGVTGAMLILLHTSFKFRGLAALSFWSMVIVALSGVLGRYLYRQIPRARNGDELSLEQAKVKETKLSVALMEMGVAADSLSRLEVIAQQGPPADGGLLELLLRLPAEDFRLRLRLRDFHKEFADVPPRLRGQAVSLALRKARLVRRIALWQRLQQLFHYWHVLHKPFAVVMYVFLAIHVAVVTITGYGLGAG